MQAYNTIFINIGSQYIIRSSIDKVILISRYCTKFTKKNGQYFRLHLSTCVTKISCKNLLLSQEGGTCWPMQITRSVSFSQNATTPSLTCTFPWAYLLGAKRHIFDARLLPKTRNLGSFSCRILVVPNGLYLQLVVTQFTKNKENSSKMACDLMWSLPIM
jgi:hypothetical protein